MAQTKGLAMPKGGDFMPIKWSVLRVSEAMDMAEEFVLQAAEPLEQARLVLQTARKTPNLPQCVLQRILATEGEVTRTIGGSYLDPIGRIRSAIQSVRKSLPEGAVDDERKRAEYGTTISLI
jgi:hypothetical protein